MGRGVALWLAHLPAIWYILGSIPGLGVLGAPIVSKSDEEKRNGLRTLVHIQCNYTMKYSKSPKNSRNVYGKPTRLLY